MTCLDILAMSEVYPQVTERPQIHPFCLVVVVHYRDTQAHTCRKQVQASALFPPAAFVASVPSGAHSPQSHGSGAP